MAFPLGFWDISLLLAVSAIILLITLELLSPQYGLIKTSISRKKLKNAALVTSMLFLATVVIRIITIITTL